MKMTNTESTLVAVGDTATTMTSRVANDGAIQVMGLLVNLYADPIGAVIREYVANGVDATKAAGSTNPVNIKTPTRLDPLLVVTDHGTGMTMQELEHTYLTFAASTKRDNNDQVGGLGVGAKSAWAIAESFQISTIKNGRLTVVRASKNLEHQVLVAEQPTTEPNGTTVSVPVEYNAVAWDKKIAQVATAHNPGTVTVDGQKVDSIAGGLNQIGPVIAANVTSNRWGHYYMVRSGGTLFGVPDEINKIIERVVDLEGCVINLPIGSFDHTPSRESLRFTPRSAEAVKDALDQYKVAYADVELKINELSKTNISEAVKLRANTVGAVGNYTVLPINKVFKVPGSSNSWVSHRRWMKVGDTKSETHVIDTIGALQIDKELKQTIMVTGVPAGRQLRTFAKYIKDNHHSISRVIPLYEGMTGINLAVVEGTTSSMTPTGQIVKVDPTMLQPGNVYTWDAWREATAPTVTGSRGPNSGYTCYVVNVDGTAPMQTELSAKDILNFNLPVWFVEGDDKPEVMRVASVGIQLGRRQVGPLLRNIPTAIPVSVWHRKCHAKVTATWTDTVRTGLMARHMGRDVLVAASKAHNLRVSAGALTFAVLAEAAAIQDASAALTQDQIDAFESIFKSSYEVRQEFEPFRKAVSVVSDQINRAWPLTGRIYGRIHDNDVVEYLTQLNPKELTPISAGSFPVAV